MEQSPGMRPRLDAGDELTPHDALVGVSLVLGGPACRCRQLMRHSAGTGRCRALMLLVDPWSPTSEHFSQVSRRRSVEDAGPTSR
jgi:hypothetical protein